MAESLNNMAAFFSNSTEPDDSTNDDGFQYLLWIPLGALAIGILWLIYEGVTNYMESSESDADLEAQTAATKSPQYGT